jgi:hypothetical protein
VNHRSGRTSRRDSDPDRRLLVAGLVLVATSLCMAAYEPLQEAFSASSPPVCPESLVQLDGARP